MWMRMEMECGARIIEISFHLSPSPFQVTGSLDVQASDSQDELDLFARDRFGPCCASAGGTYSPALGVHAMPVSARLGVDQRATRAAPPVYIYGGSAKHRWRSGRRGGMGTLCMECSCSASMWARVRHDAGPADASLVVLPLALAQLVVRLSAVVRLQRRDILVALRAVCGEAMPCDEAFRADVACGGGMYCRAGLRAVRLGGSPGSIPYRAG
ncbi:hypothetical protein B0H19DRAFT_715336 [Mycena capillaripes]|nr:hypothetical protein B0H19DRAFT_715336 [Mycena capillaripes]